MDEPGSEERPSTKPGVRGKRRTPRRRLVVHPLLFAAFPVLYLWATNLRGGITFSGVAGAIALLVGAAAALWLVGTIVLGDARTSGTAVSIVALLFFFCGFLHEGNGGVRLGDPRIANWPAVLAAAVAIAIAGTMLAVRWGDRLAGLTRGLNVAAAALLVLTVVPIVVGPTHRGIGASQPSQPSGTPSLGDNGRRPDIYYIVLDEYGGRQALHDYFHFDNSPFLDYLAGKGFTVPSDSVTNYPRTELSVAASLNMKYVNYLTRRLGTNTRDIAPLFKLIQDNRVGRVMQSLGYRYIQLGSWWPPTSDSPIADANIRYGERSPFDRFVYRTSGIRPLPSDDYLHQRWKDVRFQFRALTQLRRFKGPRFVFAHILCPHGPIVFKRDGTFLPPAEGAAMGPAARYVDQLSYVNTQVEKVVDTLLSRPEGRRPVIIIQSDEGPYSGAPVHWGHPTISNLERKFGILNSYYFPGIARPGLYPKITPVNSFRLLFNLYFGMHLPLLPDRSYIFRSLSHLYAFTDVTRLAQRLTASGPSAATSPP